MGGPRGPDPWSGREIATAMGLGAAAAIALGFSRFAYALLLPPMRDALGLTYAEARSLNTANGVGYIVGALACAALAQRFGAVRTFRGAVLVSALLLLATPSASRLGALFAIRTLGGVSTALTFILGAALAGSISTKGRPARGGFLVGIYMAGAGAGIVVSGLVVPAVLGRGSDGWRLGWLLLGALSLAAVVPAWVAAGSRGAPASARPAGQGRRGFADLAGLLPVILGYGFFGAGYSGFMTFVVVSLDGQGTRGLDVSAFWLVLGVASTALTLVWGCVLGRLRGGAGPALAYGLAMAGTLPLLVHPAPVTAFATALVFGGSIMAGPAAITVVARQRLAPQALTLAVSVLTVAFALGQAVGPLLAGKVTDLTGSIVWGLWTSPALLGAGVLASLALRASPPSTDDAV